MTSPSGLFHAVLQNNGTLIIGYNAAPPVSGNETILWTGGNAGIADGNYRAVMIAAIFGIQRTVGDGHYTWQINEPFPSAATIMSLQDDGQLVMLEQPSTVLWSSGSSDAIKTISNVTAVNYNVGAAAQEPSMPTDIYTQVVTNEDPENSQTSTIEGSSDVSETSTWNSSVTVGTTVTTSFETGIPIIAQGKVEVSVNTSYQYQWGGSKTSTKSWGFNTPVTVEPNSKMEVFISVTITKLSVPYVTTCDVQFDSGNIVKGANVVGTYTGLNSHDLTVEFRPFGSVNDKHTSHFATTRQILRLLLPSQVTQTVNAD